MYLELLSPTDCKLYGSKGNCCRNHIGKRTSLFITGDNKVSFSCTGPEDVNTRVQITVIGHGKPLDIK